ncbi:MAG: hypothetical protein Q8Q89_02880 [bacterium]|nr:hypothetical protein [bacterium]
MNEQPQYNSQPKEIKTGRYHLFGILSIFPGILYLVGLISFYVNSDPNKGEGLVGAFAFLVILFLIQVFLGTIIYLLVRKFGNSISLKIIERYLFTVIILMIFLPIIVNKF